jgi:hypothetical protein
VQGIECLRAKAGIASAPSGATLTKIGDKNRIANSLQNTFFI